MPAVSHFAFVFAGRSRKRAAVAAGLIWFIGVWPFLLVQLPIILLAGSVGVWLFYVQHQFEMTFWAHEGGWSFEEAALHGSSHYDLPGILRWFTANIGVHHVHHLCSRIPYYRLPRVLREAGLNRQTRIRRPPHARAEVVLLSLRVGPHVPRRHQPRIMTKRLKPATEMMRANAGFHADQARRHIGKPPCSDMSGIGGQAEVVRRA